MSELNDLLASPTTLDRDKVSSMTDEALVSTRTAVIAQKTNPEKSVAHSSMVTPLVQGSAMFGAIGLAQWLAPLKEASKTTRALVQIGIPALVGIVVGYAFERNLKRKSLAEIDVVSTNNANLLNGEVAQRTGMKTEDVGYQPINAADMQRMKEAHQSRKPEVTHVENLANENQPTANLAAR